MLGRDGSSLRLLSPEETRGRNGKEKEGWSLNEVAMDGEMKE